MSDQEMPSYLRQQIVACDAEKWMERPIKVSLVTPTSTGTGAITFYVDLDEASELITELSRFTVTPKDETEWEYGVRHVDVDGWPTTRPHLSLANAVEDFVSCGLHCSVVRRRRPGEWEPVHERTDRA